MKAQNFASKYREIRLMIDPIIAQASILIFLDRQYCAVTTGHTTPMNGIVLH
jgi:hypothetical protein